MRAQPLRFVASAAGLRNDFRKDIVARTDESLIMQAMHTSMAMKANKKCTRWNCP